VTAHQYLRKLAACLQVGARRGLVPKRVTFPRKPRSSVDAVYELASDFGACVLLLYRLSRNDEPELWPVVAGLQPELGVCLRHYLAALDAERQQEDGQAALDALEARTRADVRMREHQY
jgi:hypothetical protein